MRDFRRWGCERLAVGGQRKRAREERKRERKPVEVFRRRKKARGSRRARERIKRALPSRSRSFAPPLLSSSQSLRVPVHSVAASCLRKAVDTRGPRFGTNSYEEAERRSRQLRVERRRARAKGSVRYSKKGRRPKNISPALFLALGSLFPRSKWHFRQQDGSR